MTPHDLLAVPVVALALFLGYMLQPALNIVRIDARGLGHEHLTPWRRAKRAVKALANAANGSSGTSGRVAFGLAMLLACLLVPLKAAACGLALGTLTEGIHTGEFLAWESSQYFRENVTVLSGQNLGSGAVIGRVNKGIGRISVPAVSGTGNGTVGTVFAGPEVQAGNYVATCTVEAANAGTFSVVNPAGKALPNATVGVAYTSREINFTIADGSSDYIVGDSFTFVVDTTAPTVLGGTGTGTISALSLGPDAKPGRYQVIAIEAITNGGRWQVFGPDGTSIGEYLQTAGSGTASAFTNREINFTITDATDFIVGNSFEVTVFNQLSGGKVVAWDPTTFDGRHIAAGVLLPATDATSADKAGVIVSRHAVLVKSGLQWGAAITAAQKESAYADLAKRSVIAVDGVTV